MTFVSDNLPQSYLWGKVFCSEKDLPEFYVQRISILASVSHAHDLLPSKIQLDRPLFLVVHSGDDFGSEVEHIELLRNQHLSGRIVVVTDYCRVDDLVSAFSDRRRFVG